MPWAPSASPRPSAASALPVLRVPCTASLPAHAELLCACTTWPGLLALVLPAQRGLGLMTMLGLKSSPGAAAASHLYPDPSSKRRVPHLGCSQCMPRALHLPAHLSACPPTCVPVRSCAPGHSAPLLHAAQATHACAARCAPAAGTKTRPAPTSRACISPPLPTPLALPRACPPSPPTAPAPLTLCPPQTSRDCAATCRRARRCVPHTVCCTSVRVCACVRMRARMHACTQPLADAPTGGPPHAAAAAGAGSTSKQQRRGPATSLGPHALAAGPAPGADVPRRRQVGLQVALFQVVLGGRCVVLGGAWRMRRGLHAPRLHRQQPHACTWHAPPRAGAPHRRLLSAPSALLGTHAPQARPSTRATCFYVQRAQPRGRGRADREDGGRRPTQQHAQRAHCWHNRPARPAQHGQPREPRQRLVDAARRVGGG